MVLLQNHIYYHAFNPNHSYDADFTFIFKKTSIDDDLKFVRQIEYIQQDDEYYITWVNRRTLDISRVLLTQNIEFCFLMSQDAITPSLFLVIEKTISITWGGDNYTFVPLLIRIDEFNNNKVVTLTPSIDYTIVNITTTKSMSGVSSKYSPLIINNNITFNVDDLIELAFGDGGTDVYTISVFVTTASISGFAMILYQNSAENKRVNKDAYLIYVGYLNGTLRTQCSITNPSISIEMNSVPNFNYVWIPAFNRYYFVAHITSMQKDIWNIDLEVDPLMSHKETIYSQSAEIERQEFDFNPDLVDAEELAENEIDYIYIEDNTGEKIFGKDYNPDTQSYTDEVKPSTRSYVLTYYKGS